MAHTDKDTWYRELKFDKNPLDIRPNPNLVGLDNAEEELVNHIRKGEICFLTGFTGAGKTSLMDKVQDRLNNHNIIYVNSENIDKSFDLEKEIKKKRSFVDMLLLKSDPSKKPVLFLDEFQATNPELVLEVKGKWEKKKVKSVVIAQISNQMSNASGSFKERIGNRTIRLKSLEDDEMRKVLKKRLKNKKTGKNHFHNLHDETVELLVKLANYNPRRLLEYTDILFDFHHRKFKDINPVKKEDYKITFYAAKDILSERKLLASTDAIDMVSVIKERLEQKKEDLKPTELKVLRFIQRNENASTADIASEFKITAKKAGGVVSSLLKKDALRRQGMKNRRKMWALSPGMKRLLVAT